MSLVLPKPFGAFMCFERLDSWSSSERAKFVLAMAWRFTDDMSDPWTARIQTFKDRSPAGVRGASAALSAALRQLTFKTERRTAVVSCIGHADRVLPQSAPLSHLGAAAAASKGWTWLPTAIEKDPHRALKEIKSGYDRDDEVRRANYRATGTALASYERVVIIDDIVTRGATIKYAALAIAAANPDAVVWGLALGKAENRRYAEERGSILTNSEVPPSWAAAWDTAAHST